jgi:cell division septal protein FtsQ
MKLWSRGGDRYFKTQEERRRTVRRKLLDRRKRYLKRPVNVRLVIFFIVAGYLGWIILFIGLIKLLSGSA